MSSQKNIFFLMGSLVSITFKFLSLLRSRFQGNNLKIFELLLSLNNPCNTAIYVVFLKNSPSFKYTAENVQQKSLDVIRECS